MIQYLQGIRGCDGVPLRYIARSASETTPISEEKDTSNTYINYDEEMVKLAPIIESGHATNAIEEDGPFIDTVIGDRGKVWDLIDLLLQYMEVWPPMKSTRRNWMFGRIFLPSMTIFWDQIMWITFRINQR